MKIQEYKENPNTGKGCAVWLAVFIVLAIAAIVVATIDLASLFLL